MEEKFPQQSPKSLKKPPMQKPTVWQLLVSVLGAIIGVQSSKVYERDIERGYPWWVYLILGIMIILLIMIGMIFLTKWILGVNRP